MKSIEREFRTFFESEYPATVAWIPPEGIKPLLELQHLHRKRKTDMAKARRIAPTISASALSKALNNASKKASRDFGVKVGRETVVLEGGFFGKVLEPSQDSKVDPMTVAAAISRAIGRGGRRIPGTIAWPTPTWPNGPILVGFWDPPPTFFYI